MLCWVKAVEVSILILLVVLEGKFSAFHHWIWCYVWAWNVCACELFQSCPTLCDPMNCSPPSCSVYGILQVRILERVAMPSCRGSSQPRDWTCISCDSCISGRFLTTEPLGKPSGLVICHLYYAEVFSLYTQFIKNFYDTKSQSQN